jgi:hypothetical protein
MAYSRRTKMTLLESLDSLSEREFREVLTFIEFLKLRHEHWFISYADQRTQEALLAKKAGKKFATLEELQIELGG